MGSVDEVSEYRRRYEAELAAAAAEQVGFGERLGRASPAAFVRGSAAGRAVVVSDDDADAALAVIADPGTESDLLDSALDVVSRRVDKRPVLIDRLLALVRNQDLPTDRRVRVLKLLQQISFRFARFPAKRAVFLDGLRGVLDDPDPTVRRKVAGILAREKDAYVQQRLVDGLEGTAPAIVPAAKAVQFLAYDVHAEYFPLLRRLVKHPPNVTTRKEAIRAVAADPASVPLLLAILTDPSEKADVRRASFAALHAAAPAQLAPHARRIVLDDAESDDLRAQAVTMLTHFGDQAAAADDELDSGVERLHGGSPSRQLKLASAAYMSRPR